MLSAGAMTLSGGDVLVTAIEVAVRGFAGIDGLLESAADCEDFVVPEAGIERSLDDHIRGLVERDVCQVGAGIDRLVYRNSDITRVACRVSLRLVGVVDDRGGR